MAMNTPQPQKEITLSLEEIALQKALVKKEIADQKKRVSAGARRVTAPFVQKSERIGFFSRTLGTGITIMQGVFFGIKMLRKIRSFLK